MKKNNLKFIITAVCCLVLILSILYVALTNSKRTYSACPSGKISNPNGKCCDSVISSCLANAQIFHTSNCDGLANNSTSFCEVRDGHNGDWCLKTYNNCDSESGDDETPAAGGDTSEDTSKCSGPIGSYSLRLTGNGCRCVDDSTDVAAVWSPVELKYTSCDDSNPTNNDTGTTDSITCEAGKYITGVGSKTTIMKFTSSAKCTETCTKGYYCPGGTFNYDQVSYYSNPSIIKCPDGKSTSSTGAKTVDECSVSANVNTKGCSVSISRSGNATIYSGDTFYFTSTVDDEGNNGIKDYEWTLSKSHVVYGGATLMATAVGGGSGGGEVQTVKLKVTLNNNKTCESEVKNITVMQQSCGVTITGSKTIGLYDSKKGNYVAIYAKPNNSCSVSSSDTITYKWTISSGDTVRIRSTNNGTLYLEGAKLGQSTISCAMTLKGSTYTNTYVVNVVETTDKPDCVDGSSGCYRCDQADCLSYRYKCLNIGGTYMLSADEEGYCVCGSAKLTKDSDYTPYVTFSSGKFNVLKRCAGSSSNTSPGGGNYTPTNNGGNNNGGSNGNPNTGPTLIYIVWSIGLLMIGYSIWYFKKGIKE